MAPLDPWSRGSEARRPRDDRRPTAPSEPRGGAARAGGGRPPGHVGVRAHHGGLLGLSLIHI
ncbi:MAG TPA: hypothetical protein DEU94_00105, partial [Micrococcus luteus]|nr:hypothetical protein [Micrococcus luteus]